jgi:hypothetical protein
LWWGVGVGSGRLLIQKVMIARGKKTYVVSGVSLIDTSGLAMSWWKWAISEIGVFLRSQYKE